MKQRIIAAVHGFENLLAIVAILLLGFFPTLSVVARSIFHTGVANSTEYTLHLVFFLTFIGGMITSRLEKHLSLSLDLKLPERWKLPIRTTLALLSTLLTTALAWAALGAVLSGIDPQAKIGPLHLRTVLLVMPLGYAVMAVRFITVLPAGNYARKVAAVGLVLGTLLAVPSIFRILETLSITVPAALAKFPDLVQPIIHHAATPLILLLVISAVFGTPIFLVLGGIGYLLFARSGEMVELIANEAYSLLIDQAMPAIPLFAFTGFVLSESKAGERLVGFFRSLFGWMPGGLAVMAVLVCTFFTTFTGASGVTILALGALLSYILANGGYDRKFGLGLLTATGSIGLLFPPSLPIIIYGVVAQVSIKDMFLGGILPGVLLVATMVLFSMTHAGRAKIQREPFRPLEVLKSLRHAFWEILLPVVIMVCYFGGITTLVESGAIAVIYSLLVEVVIQRDLRLRDLPGVMLKCMPIVGGVLTILALAKGLSTYIIFADIPTKLTAWIQATIHSKYIFLLLLNIGLLITGCFLDIFSAILVVVPLILPLGQLFGIDPIHLGIIFLANLELGYLTPPVGLNLYLASYRFEEPITKIYREVLPFLFIQLTAVLLITYFPFLSTFLPSLGK